jgi:hypothetical protein
LALVSFDEDAFVRESREDGATDDEPWEDLGMDLDAEVIDADGSVIFFLAGSEDMIEEVLRKRWAGYWSCPHRVRW